MADVLFVNPRSFNTLPSYLPYGILYISGFLRSKGLSVEIYDTNVEEMDFKEFLKRKKPGVVGFSVLSGLCIGDAVKKSKIVREVYSDVPIVWGGIHTTIFPDYVLRQPYVDYIVMNEGEHPMLELANKLLDNKSDIEDILNLGYKTDGRLVKNKLRPFIDMDELPLPAWDLVPIERYIHNKFYCDRVITLHTSRGCPWSCSYCYNEQVNFRRWRGLSPEKILEQVMCLKDNYGLRGFQFYDDEFDANPKRVVAFCDLLLKERVKIKWAHYSRTNIADEERYALEKKAGCCFIEFGVESGSPRILEKIRKGQNVEGIKEAFDICHRVGLKTGAMFMVGMPTETREDVDKTVGLVKSIKAHQTINTIFRPYPGSELFDYCVSKGLFKVPEDLEGQAEVFNIGSASINVSDVDTAYLQSIHGMFTFNNVINAIKGCVSSGNWRLLIYYMKKLNPGSARYLAGALSGWVQARKANPNI